MDILINNVGGPSSEANARKSWFEIDSHYCVATYYKCVVAGVRFAQLLVPEMTARQWGRVINLSSVIGAQPREFVSDYAAAKAAVNNTTIVWPMPSPTAGSPSTPSRSAAS